MRPLPPVLGLTTITFTSGLTRSFQSFMPLGLPLRTKNSMVEVVGAALLGNRLAQSLATMPVPAKNSTSVVVFIVTTSASSPSLTERAWALEPPWDWSILTSLPVVFLWLATKAAL